MKPKKREKEKPVQQPEENTEADFEKFIQTFEKPTKIYRYLRTRHYASPIFLQRTLHYMRHRRSVGNAKRKTFEVDSLLGKKLPICKQEEEIVNSNQTQVIPYSPEIKYLKLEFIGFYDDKLSSDTPEVEIEAIVTKVQQRVKVDGSTNLKQTSLGKVKAPVNPSEKQTGTQIQSSPDGTQTDVEPSRPVIISQEGFNFKHREKIKSYVLHLSVTCHLSGGHSNGVCNDSDTDEPQPKKRKSATNGTARSASLDDDVIVYGTELNVYGKHDQCLLKDGEYDLVLQELGTKFPIKNDGTWDSAVGRKPIDLLDAFDVSPTLKFKLSWTDDLEGKQPCKIRPSEFITNNQYSNQINFSGFDIESSTLKLKEETQSTPTKKIQVAYQFLYNENTRQQTDTRDDLHCPWCSLNCEKLYSLLKHLRLCHARFNIIYVPTPMGCRIDISVNDSYDGSYSGNPQDLNSHIGFAFSRLGPVRRTSITHVVVYRPKRPSQSLLEFYEPEKENQVSRQIIQGHNRLYYRTNTCLPLKPQEIDQDSEEETMPQWLRQKSVNLIDEFTDVNEGEKELMKLWNLHCMKYTYIADCQIPQACQSFVEEHGQEVLEKGIIQNFNVHLVNMFDYSLISPEIVQRTMWQLNMMKDDLEMSGVLPVTDVPVY